MNEKERNEVICDFIYNIEHGDCRKSGRREFYKQCVKSEEYYEALTDDMDIRLSDDFLCYYLFRSFPDQRRSFFKCIPISATSTREMIIENLNAQRWSCL